MDESLCFGISSLPLGKYISLSSEETLIKKSKSILNISTIISPPIVPSDFLLYVFLPKLYPYFQKTTNISDVKQK